jgi:hypothetical protein
MKITKQRLKQIIKEELANSLTEASKTEGGAEWAARDAMGPGSRVPFKDQQALMDDYWKIRHAREDEEGQRRNVAGQDVPNEEIYPELLEAIKEVLDLAFGEDNYNLYKELHAIAEFKAKSGV